MKCLCIDPSGTGTTGIFFFKVSDKSEYTFSEYKSTNWQEHLNFIIDVVKEWKPDTIVYENTTYIYSRQHQGTVGLYKLIGGIVTLKYVFNFIKEVNSVAVNQVKPFKDKLFLGQEQIESLTCKAGRGKGWRYRRRKISLHQLDALVVYHLWSDKSLESTKAIKKKIAELKVKKRLGIRQKEQLEKLEILLVKKNNN